MLGKLTLAAIFIAGALTSSATASNNPDPAVVSLDISGGAGDLYSSFLLNYYSDSVSLPLADFANNSPLSSGSANATYLSGFGGCCFGIPYSEYSNVSILPAPLPILSYSTGGTIDATSRSNIFRIGANISGDFTYEMIVNGPSGSDATVPVFVSAALNANTSVYGDTNSADYFSGSPFSISSIDIYQQDGNPNNRLDFRVNCQWTLSCSDVNTHTATVVGTSNTLDISSEFELPVGTVMYVDMGSTAGFLFGAFDGGQVTVNASGYVDPIFTIDPNFLQQNPGYSLSFSPNVGNSVAAIPEPASWALMLFGFCSLGAVVRSRPRRSNLVAA